MAVLVSAVFRSIQCGHLKHQVSKTDQIQANTFPGKEVHYHVTRLQHAIHHGPMRNVMTAMPKQFNSRRSDSEIKLRAAFDAQ